MKKNIFAICATVIISATLLAGCGGTTELSNISNNSYGAPKTGASYDIAAVEGAGYYEDVEIWIEDPDFNTEEYKAIDENGFRVVTTSPLSTFAADVDTASYANLRRMLNYGYTLEDIPEGAVRAEEMINYFTYNYSGPREGEPFGVTAEIFTCPWQQTHKLVKIGFQTEAIDFSNTPDSNIVFLIDVSGSMYDEDKLPLLKEAFSMLVEELSEKDRVSIVTYAGYDEVLLEGASGDDKRSIMNALNQLEAGGSTNGSAGIETAYEIANKNFIEGGNNRVILATDGDLNVGITDESSLKKLIEKKKEEGVFLSVLGFGTGNYSDTNLEALADTGNGNYAYIDSLKEAKKVLVDDLSANMLTVAKDVKFQIEFNPQFISSYRQIGYENRAMDAEDFADDKKDGGEIGAGHSVTVLYELVHNDGTVEEETTLKYQDSQISDTGAKSGEWMTLSVRYKEPYADESKLLTYLIGENQVTESPTEDSLFAAYVAEFAMILSDSEYLGNGGLDDLKKELAGLKYTDEYKKEFIDMVYSVD